MNCLNFLGRLNLTETNKIDYFISITLIIQLMNSKRRSNPKENHSRDSAETMRAKRKGRYFPPTK